MKFWTRSWVPFAFVLAVSMSGAAQAALHDRGGGLIYDDVLNVTWLQDVTYASQTPGYYGYQRMTWNDAVIWAASLAYYDSVRGKLLTGWRLPSVSPLNGVSFNYVTSKDGSADDGWNISAPGTIYQGSTASELAYMYYVTLGNKSRESPTGVLQPDGGLRNTGPFLNLEPAYIWSGNGYVDYGPTTCQPRQCAWMFSTQDYGAQFVAQRGLLGMAWAVRDGDVATVPEANTYVMFAAGLALVGVIAQRRRQRR